MKFFLSVLLSILAAGLQVLGQISVHVPDNSVATGAGNLIPLWANGGQGWTYVARIPASRLSPVYGLRRLNEISLAPSGANYLTSTWSSGSIRIGIGHVPTALPLPFSFPVGASIGSFLDFTVLYDSALAGPFSWSATAGVWSPLGFSTGGGTSFCWDGIHDVAFFLTTLNATSSGAFSGECTQSTSDPLRVYAASYGAAVSTGSGTGGLKMRLDFTGCAGLPPQFETNDLSSSLTFNGLQGTNFSPAITRACTGSNLTVSAAASGGNLPWEAAYNTSPLIPRAFLFNSGQMVNLNLGGGLFFLLGGTAPAFAPFPGNFTTTLNAGNAPGIICFQMLNINPASSDGFFLSQACQVEITAFNQNLPAAGPNCDDCAVQLNVGCMRGLFGLITTSIFVQSNGRLTFGGGSSYPTPSVNRFLADPASFGVWADFNAASPALVSVSQPTTNEIRVDYAAVVYKTTTVANTFALIFNHQNGTATIDGIQGIVPTAGTHPMLIGISGGSAVGATDPGPANYGPAPAAGLTLNGTDAIYALGLAGTFTSGINRIIFAPNPFGNYDWVSN